MPEEKSVFERLDDISEGQSRILNEIVGVRTQTSEVDSRIEKLERKIQDLENKNAPRRERVLDVHPKTEAEIMQIFLKRAKKCWRWFGNEREFEKWKSLAISSLLILFVIGIVSTIVSSICFRLYSTFTLIENIWLIFGIIYLVYASKTQLNYEVSELASNSPYKYKTDNLGMKFLGKEKVIFRIFRWLAIISVPLNIICIWAGMGKGNQIFATAMEVLFLGAIIFAYFMNLNLYAQYAIIWVEGHNLTTNEKVVLVLPPGAKQLMPEEEFRKKMPIFYE